MKTVHFYWDIGSTNTYFAFHLLRPLAKAHDAHVVYHPFNLGYVFRHHGYALTQEPAAKMKNRKVDLMRWARRYRPDFRVPKEFPIKTSRILRGALVMREHDLEEAFMEHMFERYWEQGDASIATYAGMAESVASLGVDPATFAEAAEAPELKARFIEETQAALDAGVFGAPVMVIDGEIYWGKDRFDFIEHHLRTGASF